MSKFVKKIKGAIGITCERIITARIRRMTEGHVFTLSTIAGGGGTPSSPADRGERVPLSSPDRGRGSSSGCQGGTTIWPTRKGGYPPSQDWMGVNPPVRTGWGPPPPPLGLDGGTPPPPFNSYNVKMDR